MTEAMMETAAKSAQPCKWCGTALEKPDAKRCAKCDLWQGDGRCCVCKEPIPDDAKYCNACKSFQSRWRYVSLGQATLALVTALLAVLSAVLPQVRDFLNRNSDTSFVVASCTRDVVLLSVANTGRSASVLQRFAMSFGDLPLETVPLRVVPEDREKGRTYIAPGTSILRLQAAGITRTRAVNKPQVAAMLTDARTVTLMVWIKESDDPAAGPWTKVPATVPASFVREFVLGRIPDHD
jgi:predicted nucleic acid-binding Zn ribbon protein